MSKNCFLRETVNPELLSNVTNLCSECYTELQEFKIVFYDMKNYRYLCESCKNTFQEQLDENCEILNNDGSSLFSS